MDRLLPRYPVYVPSKGRFENCLTVKKLIEDGVPFFLVLEEEQVEEYTSRYVGDYEVLVLPESNQGLIYARNWIKDHSVASGAERHWQLDDNIIRFSRWFRAKRIPCLAGVALHVAEAFVDRYENVAVAGLNYEMFAIDPKAPPFYLNVHVYSCSLILNSIPHRWRLRYNDDTDLCLQVLSDGWCTVLLNAFLAKKLTTMVMGGGNTDDLYRGDGRAVMARQLERVWPGVVETKRRFRRPQHVVKDNWRRFDTPLKKKPGLEVKDGVDEFGMKLRQVWDEVKNPELKKLVSDD